MNYLIQFSVILGISFVAEILAALVPVPIPASIYGLVIMLLALIFKLIKVSQIRETVSFFMQIMPVIFIPAGAASGAVTQIFYKIALARVKRRLYAAAHEQDGVNTKGVDAKLEREILSGDDKK